MRRRTAFRQFTNRIRVVHQNQRRPYIGRPLPRLEDRRLVAGQGRFTDDMGFPGQAYAAVVRSPHAHARIIRVNTGAAMARPGVLAVITAADYAAAGGRGIAHMANPAATYDVATKAFTGPGRQTPFERPHPPLAVDRVRFVGEPVAMAIADSPLAAQDACEAVLVDYEVLPAVIDALAALAPGASMTRLWVTSRSRPHSAMSRRPTRPLPTPTSWWQ